MAKDDDNTADDKAREKQAAKDRAAEEKATADEQKATEDAIQQAMKTKGGPAFHGGMDIVDTRDAKSVFSARTRVAPVDHEQRAEATRNKAKAEERELAAAGLSNTQDNAARAEVIARR